MLLILSKRRLITCFLILCTVLFLYGGCSKEKGNDIKKVEEIKDSINCDACKSKTPEECGKINYCVKKCDCSKATGKGKDEKTSCKKIVYNGTTTTHCASNATVVDGKGCTTDDDCHEKQQCKQAQNGTFSCVSFDCPENQTQYKHTCVPVIEDLGDVCVDNDDCMFDQSCIMDIDVNKTLCKGLNCLNTQIPINHTCITTAGLPCLDDTTCATVEHCIDPAGGNGTNSKVCTALACPQGQKAEDHICKPAT